MLLFIIQYLKYSVKFLKNRDIKCLHKNLISCRTQRQLVSSPKHSTFSKYNLFYCRVMSLVKLFTGRLQVKSLSLRISLSFRLSSFQSFSGTIRLIVSYVNSTCMASINLELTTLKAFSVTHHFLGVESTQSVIQRSTCVN